MCVLCATSRSHFVGGFFAPDPQPTGPQAAAPPSITLSTGISSVLTNYYWSGSTITYSIATAGSAWNGYAAGGAFNEPFLPEYAVFSTSQAAHIRTALERFDELITLSFTEQNATTNAGQIRFAFTNVGSSEAYAYFPPLQGGFADSVNGDVWYSHTKVSASFAPGTFEFQILLHEIGHAMGLKHAHEAPNALPTSVDSSRYSVMTYNLQQDSVVVQFSGSPGAVSANYGESRRITLGHYDIAALHQRYGADATTRAGATTYTFDAASTNLQVLYDAGGNDTIDLSSQTRRSEIDLREGAYSSVNI
ncbi:MAG: M10 family metallopeptidase, partial [Beijerinckiaceae bacterium]